MLIHTEGFLYLWPTAPPDEQPVYASVVGTILEMDHGSQCSHPRPNV